MHALTPPPDDDGADLSMSKDASDWTASLPPTEHVRFFRATDWAGSNLGPLEDWSPSLRLFASFVLCDSRPACLWWGDIDNLTAIYNEHYAPLACAVHPALMGSIFQNHYPELWPTIRDYFQQAKRTRAGVNYSSAIPLVVERKGWPEETFFSGSFVPVGTPQVEGFINTT